MPTEISIANALAKPDGVAPLDLVTMLIKKLTEGLKALRAVHDAIKKKPDVDMVDFRNLACVKKWGRHLSDKAFDHLDQLFEDLTHDTPLEMVWGKTPRILKDAILAKETAEVKRERSGRKVTAKRHANKANQGETKIRRPAPVGPLLKH